MPQDLDAQFLEDTEKAVQQSLISKADADSKYESNIDMLNQQLIKLRPDAVQLQVEDVKAEQSQGDPVEPATVAKVKGSRRSWFRDKPTNRGNSSGGLDSVFYLPCTV